MLHVRVSVAGGNGPLEMVAEDARGGCSQGGDFLPIQRSSGSARRRGEFTEKFRLFGNALEQFDFKGEGTTEAGVEGRAVGELDQNFGAVRTVSRREKV